MGDLYVLKFGGNAVRGKEAMDRLSAEIARLVSTGARAVVVHGGGPEISEEMERRGLRPRKVCGVRVTDEDALDAAMSVLRRINSEMVDSLIEAGVRAVGIPGHFCARCERMPPMRTTENGMEETVDMGLVGTVADVDPSSLEDLLAEGAVPVIYPIGKDASGALLNVNADTMAAGVAAGVRCSEMIAITDVPGILRDVSDMGSRIPSLTMDEARALIEDGTVSGGMIPKVEACFRALEAGVPAVRMVDGTGRSGGSFLTEGGTMITR